MDIVEELCKILKPFQECTKSISTESSNLISLVRPLLTHMMSECRSGISSNPSIHELKVTIRNDLEKRSVKMLIC